ncbi:hypothetical protein NSR00_11400 [Aeribacillus sp. FSL K6-8394]|uniref:hypothetical protein n=1 Tax=Aeribacillus sp. FSL K6-8394 TaxID=2954570 RepID=UPI0030F565E4
MVEIDCLSFVEAVWHSSEEVVETLENLPPNKALLRHRKINVALGTRKSEYLLERIVKQAVDARKQEGMNRFSRNWRCSHWKIRKATKYILRNKNSKK